jgi:hypothetical protein
MGSLSGRLNQSVSWRMSHAAVIINKVFSTPIVMVIRKDNSWRMFLDYRYLNKITMKGKFLNFSMSFMDSLLYKVGYHQIRWIKYDILKASFWTNGGHHDVLVMSFGLTNAPSTFQSLLNKNFIPSLKKFVLVFFDDKFIERHEKNTYNISSTINSMQKGPNVVSLNKRWNTWVILFHTKGLSLILKRLGLT